MRLLEFNQAKNGAEPQQTAHIAARPGGLPKTPASRVHPERKPARSAKSATRVFPIQGKAVRTPAQRGPIDLETLQQRVELLEKRIKLRTEKRRAAIPDRELEEIRQRLLKLERNINSELWAARQREHTMLEMLARPSLGVRISQHMTRIRNHTLPAIGGWLKFEARDWWQDMQPDWWQGFARAWQESFKKARGY